jgi:hypothetical protein
MLATARPCSPGGSSISAACGRFPDHKCWCVNNATTHESPDVLLRYGQYWPPVARAGAFAVVVRIGNRPEVPCRRGGPQVLS